MKTELMRNIAEMDEVRSVRRQIFDECGGEARKLRAYYEGLDDQGRPHRKAIRHAGSPRVVHK